MFKTNQLTPSRTPFHHHVIAVMPFRTNTHTKKNGAVLGPHSMRERSIDFELPTIGICYSNMIFFLHREIIVNINRGARCPIARHMYIYACVYRLNFIYECICPPIDEL